MLLLPLTNLKGNARRSLSSHLHFFKVVLIKFLMYPDEFIAEMAQLPFNKQCLFGLSQAERILHFYENFEEEWEVDQPYEVMVNALNEGYSYIITPTQSIMESLMRTIVEVEKGIPDTDEYRGGTEVDYGQNAALALYCSLKFMIYKKIDTLEDAIGKTIDTIDGVVLDHSDDENMDTQPYIDQEIALQLDYLEYIAGMEFSQTGIQALRDLNQQNIITP